MAFSGEQWQAQSYPPAGDADHLRVAGKNYVRLAAWSRANNLQFRWTRKDHNLTLSGRSIKMDFAVDSRESELNGVNVRLSFPVVLSAGTAWISQIDVDAALNPSINPPRNGIHRRVHNLVIDAGHGGKDPGFLVGSQAEKKYALLLALELSQELTRAGFNVSLTRSTDIYVERPDRPEIALRRNADLFISLHWNSVTGGKSEVRGAQTFCLTPSGAPSSNDDGNDIGDRPQPGNRSNDKNFLLAHEIQKSLKSNLGVVDRGVLRARFEILRLAQMPSVLIEGGFMSHPQESRQIYDPIYRRQMARAIVAGVQSYKGIVERQK